MCFFVHGVDCILMTGHVGGECDYSYDDVSVQVILPLLLKMMTMMSLSMRLSRRRPMLTQTRQRHTRRCLALLLI